MNIVKIYGGLGNQLFQYAFGKLLEKKLNISVKYDIQTEITSKNLTKRNLDIEKFDIYLPSASENEISNLIFFRKNILWRAERKLAQKMPSIRANYIVQNNAHEILKDLKNNSYYDGYWQCYKYIDDVKDELLKEVQSHANFLISYESLISQMKSCSSVSIHIRRDDYINIKVNNKLFEICEFDYYKKAIDLLKMKFKNIQFFIFTQDKEWARQNFVGENFHFVEGNSAIDDMLLMSYCKHNIIANSTFSWWGAWLNKNSEKIVIAPKKWYKGKKNIQTDNLIPEEWIRI
ncbi:alpha-1,2-fucosyltransferase [uncultured Chryseobacterium sp.]|uniref:alpha-1,2-fucosyltransferase n=1 Tax=uncultured Chryseobacterium sp. TaxID=259322 RepID=UPI0025D0D907|nr:alpha-1,2-fucosyltransferase [uncultured Chryseobacterium sp.]